MRIRLAALLLLLAGPAFGQEPARLLGLSTQGGDLRAELADRTVLHGADLAGAVLRFERLELRLDEVRRDESVPGTERGTFADDVWLFRVSSREPGGEWSEFCAADPAGERLAMVLPTEPGAFALTCSAGANGKCIRMGYRPWARLADGRSLFAWHAACVHMLRAAYGGDERGFTRDGTPVDVFDRIGLQSPANLADQAFEAGWAEDGAVCVAHPRIPANGSLSAIARHVPRLIGRTGPAACDENRAGALGALIFSRSRLTHP